MLKVSAQVIKKTKWNTFTYYKALVTVRYNI